MLNVVSIVHLIKCPQNVSGKLLSKHHKTPVISWGVWMGAFRLSDEYLQELCFRHLRDFVTERLGNFAELLYGE